MTGITWDVSLPLSGDRLERRQRISACYDRADWLVTYGEAKSLLEAYPHSVDAHIAEAALLGDYGEMFTGVERDRRKAAAVRKLRYWVRTPPVTLPRALADKAANELFYHSGDWKRQALLGRDRLREGEASALYSLGVGAAFYGAELLRRGQVVRGKRWARLGTQTWDSFFKRPQVRQRWDTHCFYAVALGALGDFVAAEAELKVVAGLIGWDIRTTNIYDIANRLRWCGRGGAKIGASTTVR